MSLGSESGCPLPKKENKSINPYVTVPGNILVSKCCGSEMSYRIYGSKAEWNIDMWEFCTQCLDCCDTLEVKASNYDREIYLDEKDNFEYEAYDSFNFQIIPKCTSIAFAMYCPYCEGVENIEPAKNVEQFEDSTIWSCHECCKFWEVDEEGNFHLEGEE
tara:strand:+ start:466 stop:945 length:480 start_codon:yes stop_codon:yes gene_type:complete